MAAASSGALIQPLLVRACSGSSQLACPDSTPACPRLQGGVHVVVGTPGRVYDMLRRRALRADSIKMFVLVSWVASWMVG